MFKAGDIVFHKKFLKGIVTKDEIEGSHFVTVQFEGDHKSEKMILKSYIELVTSASEESNATQFEKINQEENVSNSVIKIMPAGYSTSDFLASYEKEIITRLSKSITEGYIAYGTNPIGSYIDKKIGYIIKKDYGVIIFKVFSTDNLDGFCKSYSTISHAFNTDYVAKLEKWLIDSPVLHGIDGNKKRLLFPLKIIAIFPNLYFNDVKSKLGNATLDLSNIYFRGFINDKSSNINSVIQSLLEKKTTSLPLNNKLINTISSKLIPEYSVMVLENEKIEKNDLQSKEKLGQEKLLQQKFKAILLEDEQIRLVNATKAGHYLTLANPGTGKSVILISKAYRLACLYDEAVLITCYNKNLNEKYNMLKEESGFHDRSNLSIKTFHSLVYQILKDNAHHIKVDNEEINHDKNAELLFDLLSRGIIKKRYRAILIDEVQLFNPMWIDLCYMLLAKPYEESFFEMYGDLNQDVRNKKTKGIASWQNTEMLPNLQGRVRMFNKNYRNTYAISEYLNHMMILINTRIYELKCKVDKDFTMLKSLTKRKGPKPIVLNCDRQNVSKNVVRTIKSLYEKNNVDYSDIAVIFPYSQNSALRYYPLESIKSLLDSNDIPYSAISGGNAQKLIDSYGVTLSTIDSTLGLDFRVVILAGLLPINYFFSDDNKPVKMQNMGTLLNHEDKEIIDHYIKTSRQLYAAASRAREGLIIINDIDFNSVFYELINLRNGEKLYDRK